MQSNLAEKRDELYTFEDYLTWDDGQRWEIIEGRAYLMAAPNEVHHDISMALSRRIGDFLEGKSCKLFVAPFEVRLFPSSKNAKKYEKGLVQPDLFVVCDSSKRDGARINGAPDFIIEILSPSNQKNDRYLKFKQYFLAGVREYWIVDPESRVVQVCLLEEKRYFVMVYDDSYILPCTVLPGLEIPLGDIFPAD